jgi:hypothetical protein
VVVVETGRRLGLTRQKCQDALGEWGGEALRAVEEECECECGVGIVGLDGGGGRCVGDVFTGSLRKVL